MPSPADGAGPPPRVAPMSLTPATVLSPDLALAPPSRRRGIRRVAHVLVLVGVAVVAVLLVAFKASGWQALTVLTGSMRPTIVPGQVVLVSPTPVTAVRPGQVVTFDRPFGPGTVTHRVRRIAPAPGGRLSVTTQGDANPAPETWQIPATGTVGRLRAVLPAAGGSVALLVAGRGRPYFVGGVTALAALLVVWFIWRRDPESAEPDDGAEGPA